MKTKAAVHTAHGQPLVIDEIEVPDPRPDQVIVKLFSSGVCHSQLHQIHNPELPRPAVLGHEAAGIVTHVGRGVSDLKEGDHAIVTWIPKTPVKGRRPYVPSGVTYHEASIHELVVYTWGEDVLTEAEYVVPMSKDEPKDVSSIVGCAVLTGAGAVLNTARVRTGDSVAVFGVGGVGLSSVAAASILGAYPVIAVDLKDDKLDFARQFGATHVVNASRQDPVEAIVELTNGGADFAFDTIGLRVTNEQILPSVRAGGAGAENLGGTAVLVGAPGNQMTIDPNLFMRGQRKYTGSSGATYPERDFAMFLRWNREGKFPLDKLVTRRYRLEQINEACAALQAGEILGRAIIEF